MGIFDRTQRGNFPSPFYPVSGGGGGGANTALSNLAAVAFNANLIPDGDNTRSIGSTGFVLDSVWAHNLKADGDINILSTGEFHITDLSGNEILMDGGEYLSFTSSSGPSFTISSAGFSFNANLLSSNNDLGAPASKFKSAYFSKHRILDTYTSYYGGAGSPAILADNFDTNYAIFGSEDALTDVPTRPVLIMSGANTLVGSTSSTSEVDLISGDITDAGASGDTGPIIIGSGNNAGSGNAGMIQVTTGSAALGNSSDLYLGTGTAGGTRGKIRLVSGSEGTVGHVWTSTDTNGSGAWQAPSGDNLSSISESLIPTSNNTYDIGSASLQFRTIHAGTSVELFGGVGFNEYYLGDLTVFTEATTFSSRGYGVAIYSESGFSATIQPIDSDEGSGDDVADLNIGGGSVINGTSNRGGDVTISGGKVDAGTGRSGSVIITAPSPGGSGAKGFCDISTLFMNLPRESADPTVNIVAGSTYYNTTSNKVKFYNGTTWETVTSA